MSMVKITRHVSRMKRLLSSFFIFVCMYFFWHDLESWVSKYVMKQCGWRITVWHASHTIFFLFKIHFNFSLWLLQLYYWICRSTILKKNKLCVWPCLHSQKRGGGERNKTLKIVFFKPKDVHYLEYLRSVKY